MRFPSKVISHAHAAAAGKIFTWSPGRQVFTDEAGCTDYNYFAMIWLKDNGVLVKLPWDGKSIAYRFEMRP